MANRYTIETALQMDESQPPYLLIAWGKEGAICRGQYHSIEDCVLAAHALEGNKPQAEKPMLVVPN